MQRHFSHVCSNVLHAVERTTLSLFSLFRGMSRGKVIRLHRRKQDNISGEQRWVRPMFWHILFYDFNIHPKNPSCKFPWSPALFMERDWGPLKTAIILLLRIKCIHSQHFSPEVIKMFPVSTSAHTHPFLCYVYIEALNTYSVDKCYMLNGSYVESCFHMEYGYLCSTNYRVSSSKDFWILAGSQEISFF